MRRFSRRNMGGLQVYTPQFIVVSHIFVRRDTTVYTPHGASGDTTPCGLTGVTLHYTGLYHLSAPTRPIQCAVSCAATWAAFRLRVEALGPHTTHLTPHNLLFQPHTIHPTPYSSPRIALSCYGLNETPYTQQPTGSPHLVISC